MACTRKIISSNHVLPFSFDKSCLFSYLWVLFVVTVALLMLTPQTAQTAPLPTLAQFYQRAKSAYFNTGTPLVDDATFDAIEAVFRKRAPNHPALRVTGAATTTTTAAATTTRGGRDVTLPYWMGSQDKLYPDDTKAFARWRKRVPETTSCMASVKLDGVSAILDVTRLRVRLLSRGDGQTASDWSAHLPHMPKSLTASVNRVQESMQVSGVQRVVIRGEAILSEKSFHAHREALGWTSTARNVVSGLLNAKHVTEQAKQALRWIDMVCYEVVEPVGWTPSQQLRYLDQHRFRTVSSSLGQACNATVLPNAFSLTDLEPLFWTYRKESPYATDGVVVTADRKYTRNTSGNPNYSFAFKMKVNDASQTSTTTVKHVEWNISRTRFLKPTIVLAPVTIGGVHVQRTTGFNYRFIQSQGIGPGARVEVRRCGDVIPNVTAVVTPAKVIGLPKPGTYTLTSSKVDAIATHPEAYGDHQYNIEVLTHFFKVFKVAHLSEKTIARFVEHGYTDPFAILRCSANELEDWDGFGKRLSTQLVNDMRTKTRQGTAVQWVLAGNVLGRGMGERKLLALFRHDPQWCTTFSHTTPSSAQLREAYLALHGFQAKTIDPLLEIRGAFRVYWKRVDTYLKEVGGKGAPRGLATKTTPSHIAKASGHKTSGKLSEHSGHSGQLGQVYYFTGFRDDALKAQLEARGGEVETSFTQRVTVLVRKDAGYTNSKVDKAKARGLTVVEKAHLQKNG